MSAFTCTSRSKHIQLPRPSLKKLTTDLLMSTADKAKYSQIFHETDIKKKGFLTGIQAKEVFLKSGLSNPILAEIWGLADINRDGQMNIEEFCNAMHLIQQARKTSLDKNISDQDFIERETNLISEKNNLMKSVSDLKDGLFAEVINSEKNVNKVLNLRCHIKSIKDSITLTQHQADSMDFQLQNALASIKHFRGLLENYQLKFNLSKQEYIKLKNQLECFTDCNDEELNRRLSAKKKIVFKAKEDYKALKILNATKSKKIEHLSQRISILNHTKFCLTNVIEKNTSTAASTKLSTHLNDTNTITEETVIKTQKVQDIQQEYVALYDFSARYEDELSFRSGDILQISESQTDSGSGFLKACYNNQEGWVPENLIKKVHNSCESVCKENQMILFENDYPCNHDADIQNEDFNVTNNKDNDEMKQICIKEFITTEEAYVNDLITVSEVYYKVIEKNKLLSKEEIGIVFLNFEDIMRCNTDFLKSVKQYFQNPTGPGIGRIISGNLHLLDPYILYCSCQHKSTTLFQLKINDDNKFREAHKKMCLDSRTLGLPLTSFLLKPVQRITKYPLLIEKILKYTLPGCEDYEWLKKSEKDAIDFCNLINEATREQQNSDNLVWIQNRVQCDGLPEKLNFNSFTNCLGPRKYLHSGSLYKVRSNQELMAILFSDFFLFTHPSKPVGFSSSIFSLDIKPNIVFKLHKTPLFLNEIVVSSCLDEAPSPSFKLTYRNKTYILKALSSVERDVWVKKIENASRCYCEVEKKRRDKTYSETRKNPVGRLLVIIQEGNHLEINGDGSKNFYCHVRMGSQEQKSKVVRGINPKWNASMQFFLMDVEEDVLHIRVFSRNCFSPDDFLGSTDVVIRDFIEKLKTAKEPITVHLLLHGVDSGEIIIKLDLLIYKNQT